MMKLFELKISKFMLRSSISQLNGCMNKSLLFSGAHNCAFLHPAKLTCNGTKECKCEKVLKVSTVEAPPEAQVAVRTPKEQEDLTFYLTCADCNFRLNIEDAMTLSSDTQCPVPKCGQNFVVKHEAEAHKIMQHKVHSTKSFTCTICPEGSFRSSADVMVLHYNIAHQRCISHQRCQNSKCMTLFRSDRDISEHLKMCRATVTKAPPMGSTKRRIIKTTVSTNATKKLGVEKSSAVSIDKVPVETSNNVVHLESSHRMLCTKCPRKILTKQIFECQLCPVNSASTFPTEVDLEIHRSLCHLTKPLGKNLVNMTLCFQKPYLKCRRCRFVFIDKNISKFSFLP